MMIKEPSDLQCPTFKFNSPISISQLGSKCQIYTGRYIFIINESWSNTQCNALPTLIELSSLCWW